MSPLTKPTWHRHEKPRVDRQPTPLDPVIHAVAFATNISPEQMYGHRRFGSRIEARQITMLLAWELTALGITEIAELMHRDHSTIHCGLKSIKVKMQSDERLRRTVERIRKRVVAAMEAA